MKLEFHNNSLHAPKKRVLLENSSLCCHAATPGLVLTLITSITGAGTQGRVNSIDSEWLYQFTQTSVTYGLCLSRNRLSFDDIRADVITLSRFLHLSEFDQYPEFVFTNHSLCLFFQDCLHLKLYGLANQKLCYFEELLNTGNNR